MWKSGRTNVGVMMKCSIGTTNVMAKNECVKAEIEHVQAKYKHVAATNHDNIIIHMTLRCQVHDSVELSSQMPPKCQEEELVAMLKKLKSLEKTMQMMTKESFQLPLEAKNLYTHNSDLRDLY